MPRFSFNDDADDSSTSDIERENEPPHPIGFASPTSNTAAPGGIRTSRYALDFDDDTEDWLQQKALQSGYKTNPPMSSYIQTNDNFTPMKVLLRDAYLGTSKQKLDKESNQADDDDYDDEVDDDGLGGLLDALTTISMSIPGSTATTLIVKPPPDDLSYYRIGAKEDQIRANVAKQKEKFDEQNNVYERNVKEIIEKDRKEAERALAEKRQQEKEHEERVQREAKEKELARQQKEDAQKEKDAAEKKRQDDADTKARAETEQKNSENEAKAKVQAEADRKKKEESSFVEKAQKLVAQLKVLRRSVEPFDKSKPMGKRRLGMKKVVNGRVNTLSEDASKILEVARDVNAAITTARQDDQAAKTELSSGNPQVSPEMALGKRYFLDLLSSKVVVRVQAEGFNGQRGDGFPLAHMLTHVASENKDFAPILNAHIYTVCPTAIPYLPTPSADASEDDLMESLGMQKGSDGNYETFERFLNRTEGIISIVANIIASKPIEHPLFGGQNGGVLWLKRFLDQLPAAPHSPLPLITAPVLDAFLTGAGHMLANTFGEEFKKLLTEIEVNVMPRLDEGTIGAPSAMRLRNTIKDSFDGFLNNLPGRALPELYNGAGTSSGGHGIQPPNPFGNSSSNAVGSSSGASPFGAQSAPSPSPFGNSAPGPSPFGTSSGSSATAPSPFGNTSGQSVPGPSPFGASGISAPAPSPFGGTAGQSAAGPSPFGSSSGNLAQAPSPFGGITGQPASTPSPFGNNQGQFASAPSPFGNNSVAAPQPPNPGSAFQSQAAPMATSFANSGSLSSPFGGNPGGNAMNASSPSPFGVTPAQSSTFRSSSGGFGQQTSAFNNGGPSVGGGPFGAPTQGQSPFGAQVPSNPSPFGAPTSAPFGSSNQFPSGGTNNPSPFGAPAPAASPFGASSSFSNAGPSNPSPFGASAPGPSPFGGGGAAPSPSPFGSFSAAPAPSPFGGGNNGGGNNYGGQSSNKPPCRFFAKGTCKNGNNCRFSHNVQPTATTFSNPFGGPRR